MLDEKRIRDAVPVEDILCSLIESSCLNIVADGACTEDEMECILAGMNKYMQGKDDDFHIYVLGTGKDTVYIRTMISGYGMQDRTEFIGTEDHGMVLSLLLGCDAVVSPDSAGICMELGKSCHAAGICLSGTGDIRLEDGILYMKALPENIGAAMMLVRERHYTEELMGYTSHIRRMEE